MDEIGDATTDVGTCLGDQVIALVWQDGVDQTKCPYVRQLEPHPLLQPSDVLARAS